MAEEEVVVPGASPVPPDHKRKLEDLGPEAPQTLESNANSHSELDDGEKTEAAVSDEGDVKRPRLDEELDRPANANGHQDEQVGEPLEETGDRFTLENVHADDGQPVSKDLREAATDEQITSEIAEQADTQELPVEDSRPQNAEEPSKEAPEPSNESAEQDVYSDEKQLKSVDISPDNSEFPLNKQDASSGQKQPTAGGEIMTRKIEIPNNKVGVLIGKAGDTIRYLQYNSGAKIQIRRDADADPHSATRPVELIGSLDSIDKAEKLMNAVIAEADAGGSPSLVARGLSPTQVVVGSEQIQIQVPNEKVGLIIGRGGETIKGLQTKSGARIQLIPQHLPEGDDSKERTVQVTGDKRQVEIAQELIKEVMSQPVRPSTGGYGQQAYRPPRGTGGPSQWSHRGSRFGLSTAYDYQQRGPYPPHNQPYAPSPYGNYPQHMAPRSSFGSGWEQRPHPGMQGPPPHHGGYDYYGGQGAHLPDAHSSTQHPSSAPPHGAGPPVPSLGPSPAQVNYNYGPPHGQDYGNQTPYTQAGLPQQGYGHGYDESRFENRAPTQHPYGGNSAQPTYAQAGTQPNFVAPQQYGKPPSYGRPPQGQPSQSYGPPRATQPGDMPFQGSTPSQPYGSNMPSQQPYPYVSGGAPQPVYPTYGSTPAADGYNHPQPASGQLYSQTGGQPSYGQPVAQPAASYGQVAATGAYGSYPSSQPTYPEQSAPNSAAGYGYQTPQDPSYSSGAAPVYSAAPSGQPGYAQTALAQAGYDQSNPQSASYAAVQANASAAYGNTVSPQPTYPQYDSTQVYGAPR